MMPNHLLPKNLNTMSRYITISSLCLLLFLLTASCAIQAQNFSGRPTGQERIASSDEEFEQELLRLVNVEREKRKLKPLEWKESLAWAARYHAQDMIVDRYFDHELYDRRGNRLRKVWDTFSKIKVFVDDNTFVCAENIAVGGETPEETFEQWINSPGHKENILNPKTKYMGLGYRYDENSEWGHYWVQCFGM